MIQAMADSMMRLLLMLVQRCCKAPILYVRCLSFVYSFINSITRVDCKRERALNDANSDDRVLISIVFQGSCYAVICKLICLSDLWD